MSTTIANARDLAADFLAREAMLLDERRFDEWLEMLDEAIVYEVPLRETRMNYADETIPGSFRIRDDINIIRIRVARLATGMAWSEVPPSRTCRVVGSILASDGPEPDTIAVESAVLLYRQRGTDRGDVIPVRRSDVLRVGDDGVAKLLSRRAHIAESVVQTSNLAVFL